jgi:hypothetical protein
MTRKQIPLTRVFQSAAVSVNFDVRRLQSAVNDPLPVRGFERLDDHQMCGVRRTVAQFTTGDSRTLFARSSDGSSGSTSWPAPRARAGRGEVGLRVRRGQAAAPLTLLRLLSPRRVEWMDATRTPRMQVAIVATTISMKTPTTRSDPCSRGR